MAKSLVAREADLFNWLVERWAAKDPETFWAEPSKRSRRWESWILNYWPRVLTLGYWHYLFGDLRKGHWGGYEASRWINRPERWWFKNFKWWMLFEETKLERALCRYRGHPKGEVYYSSGDEPDHHCKTCGEEIG